MNLLPVLLFALLFNVHTGWAAQSDSELLQEIQATTDALAQAKLYKVLGDRYVSQDRYDLAADAFARAFALGRESFSAMERVQMAIYLSWADRLRESERELRAVLAREPKNLAARTHLARVLSWSGELSEAVEEADKVLKESPENRDALLIKADALQWQGRFSESIPIYQRLVAKDGDFDARVGLSRSLLAVGNRVAAQENADSLKASTARQERELKKLTDAIEQEVRPSLDARYNYYRDSDHNRLNRYSLATGFWAGNQKLGLSYRHTDASDRTRDNRAEDLLFKLYSRVTDTISAGGEAGFTQLGNGFVSNFPTGQLRVDAKLFRGTAGTNVTREVLSDTAELVENRIRMTNVGLYLSQPLTDRFSIYAGYNYKDFSDSNHANDLRLNSEYAVYLSPRIIVGHRFRLLDFDRQSRSGFFDPNDYIANRGFASVYREGRSYYTYLETYLGHQRFHRNGVLSKDFIYGGSGSIGIKPLLNLAIEVNAEGGKFAAGSTAGFNYFIIGPRLLYRF